MTSLVEKGVSMAISFFEDKAVVPSESMVAEALAESYPLWQEFLTYVNESFPSVTTEWKHYGKASGWVLKTLSKKKNLFFFTPLAGCFRIRFGFGEATATNAEASDLPEVIKEALRTATHYTEGRSIDLDTGASETKVWAYVKDEGLVDIGILQKAQLETLKGIVAMRA